ncbi:MAG: hypothetical protein LH631_05275 [Alkalinema sp. CAN_BIN05]|nr:hypothetical protein [Alkalinema sp. CAN_BIN05]
MRILSKVLLSVISVSLLATLPTIAHSKEPEIVRIPQKSDLSCDGAIAAVKQDLRKRGVFSEWKTPPKVIQPRIRFDAERIKIGYYNYPVDRTEAVIFGLSGDSTKLYQGILSSPVLLEMLGAQVMAACGQVGIVEFVHWWEGSVPVGYFPDRTVRAFKWVNIRGNDHQRIEMRNGSERTVFEWGYYFSP